MKSLVATRPSRRRKTFRPYTASSFPWRASRIHGCDADLRASRGGSRCAGRTRGLVASLVLAVALLSSLSLSPSPAEARSGRAKLDRTERRVVKLINVYRARHGRPRVRASRPLSRVADRHTREMVQHGFFAHSSRNGTGATVRVRRSSGARAVGENIAFISSGGQRPAQRVVKMWINSPGHRAVLLHPSFRRIGVARRSGSVNGSTGSAYTADFASRR